MIERYYKKKSYLKVIIYGIFFIVGMLILLNSISLGDHDVYSIMKAHGGGMDTNTYLIYLEQCITKYRFIGSILSILGGNGLIFNSTTKS